MARLAPLCLLLLLSSSLWAAPRALKGTRPFELFSVPPPGGGGDFYLSAGQRVSVSDDDRFIVFAGFSSGWCPGDSGGGSHVWLYDRLPGTTRLVSYNAGGPLPADQPMISGDGSTILMGFDNGLYVVDRETGKKERVDITVDGRPSNYGRLYHNSALSDDGRKVVFASGDPAMFPGGAEGRRDVFVRDVKLNTTILASVANDGSPGLNPGEYCTFAISGDGQSVAFTSRATNLVPGLYGSVDRVFVRRLRTGKTELVSLNAAGLPTSGYHPSLSDDGRFVAFTSSAVLVDSGDASSNEDVFVRDTYASATEWASQPNAGVPAGPPPAVQGSVTAWNGTALSDDGRWVVFLSDNPWLVGGAGTTPRQVLRHEWRGKSTIMSSVSASEYADEDCCYPVISGRGEYVYFFSEAGNLGVGAEPTDQLADVFGTRGARFLSGRVTWRGGGALAGASICVKGTDGGGTEYWTHTAGDGKWQVTGLTLGNYSITPYRAGCTFSPSSRQVSLGPSLDSQWFQAVPAVGDGVRRYRGLLIGISDYVVNDLDLYYCDDDALDLRSQLLASRNWQGAYLRSVLDLAATRQRMKDEIFRLAAAADADDVCLIAFSGHGQHELGEDAWPLDEADPDDEFLCPSDCTPTTGLISDDEFGHWINRLGTASYALILDCCFSAGDFTNRACGNTRHLRSLASRRGSSAGDGIFGGFWLPRPAGSRDLNDLGLGAVLAAASKDETAQEDHGLEHGIFTNYLLEAMRGRAADTDGDGNLTPAELFAYAAPRTTLRDKTMHPAAYYGAGGAALPLLGKPRCPDLKIALTGAPLVGDNEYGPQGRHQIINATLEPGAKANFRVALQNDSTGAEAVKLTALPGTGKFAVRCLVDGEDVTAAVTGAGWWARGLTPGETVYMYVRVTARPAAAVGDAWRFKVSAALEADATHTDCVGSDVEVVAPPETAPVGPATLTVAAAGAGAEVTLHLPTGATVDVQLRTLAGVPVRRITSGRACPAGTLRLPWNLRSERGLRVPAGLYLVQAIVARADGTQSRLIAPLQVR